MMEANCGRKRQGGRRVIEGIQRQPDSYPSWKGVSALINEIALLICMLIFTVLRVAIERVWIRVESCTGTKELIARKGKGAVAKLVRRPRRVARRQISGQHGNEGIRKKKGLKECRGPKRTFESRTQDLRVRFDSESRGFCEHSESESAQDYQKVTNQTDRRLQQCVDFILETYIAVLNDPVRTRRRVQAEIQPEQEKETGRESMSDRREDTPTTELLNKKPRPTSISHLPTNNTKTPAHQPHRSISGPSTKPTPASPSLNIPKARAVKEVSTSGSSTPGTESGNLTPELKEQSIRMAQEADVALTGDITRPPIIVMGLTLPLPGSQGAPYFDGTNITAFLEVYGDICDDLRIPKLTRRERIVRYVNPVYKEQIKAMPEYCLGREAEYDEAVFYAALRKEFRTGDWEAFKSSRLFLDRVIQKSVNKEMPVKDFVGTFHRISQELIRKNEIDNVYRCREFMRGLPDRTREKVLRTTDFDPDDTTTFDYDKMYAIAVSSYELDDKRRRFEESIDPSKSEMKKEHVDRVISEIVPEQRFDLTLPKPPSGGAHETSAPAGAEEPKKAVKFSNRNVMDDLTSMLGDLKINSVSHSQLDETLSKKLEEFIKKQLSLQTEQNQAMQQAFTAALSQQQNYGGYQRRGSFGGNNFNGSQRSNFNGQQQSQGNVAAGANVLGSTNENAGSNAFRRPSSQNQSYGRGQGALGASMVSRDCFGCRGYDADGNPWAPGSPEDSHNRPWRCPLMWLLKQRGCCYDDLNGNWFRGTLQDGQPLEVIRLTPQQTYFRQIIDACRGGKYDFDLEAREKHLAMIEESKKEAKQARDAYGTKSVLPRGQPDVGGRAGSINAPEGEPELNYFFEPRLEEPISVSTAGVNAIGSTRRKSNLPSNVHETLDKRRREQERMPRARGPKAIETPENMNVDENAPAENEQIASPETLQPEEPELADEELPRKRSSRKASVSLPPISKQRKEVNEAWVHPDPEVVLEHGLRQKIAPYVQVVKGANAITRVFAEIVQESEEACKPRAVANPWAREAKPGTLEAGPGGLAKVHALTYSELVKDGHILRSPWITFRLIGPLETRKHSALIDTGAEVNVLSYELALSLGCKILQTTLSMSTATDERVPFEGMTDIRVEFDRSTKIGVNCRFFLSEGNQKTLLGQPFIRDTRMNLQFEKNGQWSGVFTDPETLDKVTMMVVPPPRNRGHPQPQAQVGDVTDEEREHSQRLK